VLKRGGVIPEGKQQSSSCARDKGRFSGATGWPYLRLPGRGIGSPVSIERGKGVGIWSALGARFAGLSRLRESRDPAADVHHRDTTSLIMLIRSARNFCCEQASLRCSAIFKCHCARDRRVFAGAFENTFRQVLLARGEFLLDERGPGFRVS